MEMLKNGTDVTMMYWEVNPAKRNINNTIGFIAKNTVAINVGDAILVDNVKTRYSITEIVNQKPAALTGYTYYTVLTKYN